MLIDHIDGLKLMVADPHKVPRCLTLIIDRLNNTLCGYHVVGSGARRRQMQFLSAEHKLSGARAV